MQKISVCIATYNGEKYILKQLQSIIPQLSEEDEIIISDDSSTDGTIEIIKKIPDNRIKLFEGQTFRSPIRNFEFAISKASNSIIFLSDQDDLWHEEKVSLMMKELQTNDLVVCDRAIIDENDNLILPSYFKAFPFRSKPGIMRNLWRHSYAGCCMAFNKKILTKALPFPKKVEFHDFWIGFVGNLFYKVKFVHKPLTLYRRHDNNVSFGAQLKSENSLTQKLLLRWNVIRYVFKAMAR